MAAEDINSKSFGIDELSHIYLTYVKVLSKLYQLIPIWKMYKDKIIPLLKVSQEQDNVESEARLLYAA